MPKQQEFYLILHNIRSAYNVGAILRTADAIKISKVYITGYTPLPSDEKVKKTALGAEINVTWEHHRQIATLLKKLKSENVEIAALEQSSKSIDYLKYKPKFPIALILGNEVNGVTPAILKYADTIIELPMNGKKESLNVSVAAGIAMYKIAENRS